MRIYWTIFDGVLAYSASLTNILVAAGAITVILGGLMCAAQHTLKRLLAFSTISHMGIMLTGFALFDRVPWPVRLFMFWAMPCLRAPCSVVRVSCYTVFPRLTNTSCGGGHDGLKLAWF